METAALSSLESGTAQRRPVSAVRGGTREQKLRKRIDEFIGVTFYGTMMKMMRSSVVKGKYGHGGRGEEVFQSQLDFELARRMGQSRHNTLGEALYRRLTGHQGLTSGSESEAAAPPRGTVSLNDLFDELRANRSADTKAAK